MKLQNKVLTTKEKTEVKAFLLNTAIPFQTPGTDLTARPQRGIAIYLNILRDILDVKG